MVDILLDTLMDVLKMMPILLAAYLVIELIQTKMPADCLSGEKNGKFGPIIGAAAGCIPQCGFSAAATALYKNGVVGAGTLAAVYLATSDEAIPVLLSHPNNIKDVVWLVAVKLVIAIIAGYLIELVFFRKPASVSAEHREHEHNHDHAEHYHDCHHPCECDGSGKQIILSSVFHTLKISAFILITMLVINILIYFIGEQRIGQLMLQGNLFQPVLTAIIGVIPGCATSVLLTQLFVDGTLSFGSAVAGLCTGAGFGYVLLFSGKRSKRMIKDNLKIMLSVYVAAALSGVILNLFGV